MGFLPAQLESYRSRCINHLVYMPEDNIAPTITIIPKVKWDNFVYTSDDIREIIKSKEALKDFNGCSISRNLKDNKRLVALAMAMISGLKYIENDLGKVGICKKELQEFQRQYKKAANNTYTRGQSSLCT